MVIKVQQQLLDALNKIDRPGTFCTSGRLPPTLPGLEVVGVGPIGLPLGKLQAAAIKKQARQAPYGKGTQTLVDTDVRRVWEVDADQVVLANPEWANVVAQVVDTVQSDLGLEKQQLDAHLYKLLLYEPKSFFLPHRDGEKVDRMVATLVIALPSAHEGGELVVRHEGREQTIDFGPGSQFLMQFAAFYADCEHEIRPVRSGFRLALVYNLTLEKSVGTIAAPTSAEHIAAVARILGAWKNPGEDARRADYENEVARPTKLAVVLDHQYSPAGLACDALKGIDRSKATVLFEAARQAGYDASLALVVYWESGSAEPADDYGYDDYDSDDEGDDFDNERGGHEMGEVIDENLSVEQFSDADGNRLAFGIIPLDEDELVAETPLNEGDADKENFEGFTGNAGMTLERWYHHAAVVLWPAEDRFEVLFEAGIKATVGGLESMVRQWRNAQESERESLKEQCFLFADRIIALWPESEFANRDVDSADSSRPTDLLSLLGALGDTSLIAAWIRRVLARDASVDPGKTLGDISQQHGWLTFQNELRNLFENTSHETLPRHARLLADFALRKDTRADHKKLCVPLAGELMSAVEKWNPHAAKRHWKTSPVDLPQLLSLLVQSFIAVQEPKLLERLVKHVLDRPKDFDLTTVQVPALLSLETWLAENVKRPCPPLRRWLTALVKELESRAANPPREPTDWRRESATGCDCADCQALSSFLKNPKTETLRLPLAEHRRGHLHQVIDKNKLDTTDVTERRGRPYTLVCTKTKASYQRALQAHDVDLDHLKKIRTLLEWHEGLSS